MKNFPDETLSILEGTHHHPHQWLGMHSAVRGGEKGLIVRVFLPDAIACGVVHLGQAREQRHLLEKIDERGFFEGFFAGRREVFPYRLWIEQTNGEFHEFYDPYSFLPTLSEDDLYLFNEGTDRQVFHKLGAHYRTVNGIPGVSFAVWAPNARRVSVTGDFNGWNGCCHPMRSMGASGVWELFIPGLQRRTLYKYELLDARGRLQIKSDPYGAFFESPPNSASIVASPSEYQWNDKEWLKRRTQTDWLQTPISIYEMHFGSWKRVPEEGNRPLSYREAAGQLVDYLRQMRYTHVEFMPLAEFPFEGSWGYQVTGFFAPTHRYGTPDDFRFLIDTLHQNNIGVFLDWVPAHFPKDAFALTQFDGTHLYEHADPRQGEHQDWGTLIFNYGRPEVRAFLIGSALSWCEQFHIDGLRVDAVASMLYLDYSRSRGQWIPNQYGGRENIEAIDFLRAANNAIHETFPGVLMIAEESTAWDGVTKPTTLGGLGFDLKWNMGWMHDTLEYFKKDPIHRKWHQNQLTFGAIYQHTEHFNLAFSHDEVVHGKSSMLHKMNAPNIPEKARQLRALYGWMWGWPGKKTLFMGSDFGQSTEWDYDHSLDWHLLQYNDHNGIQQLIADLNTFYRRHPCLGKNDFATHTFQWISHADHQSSVLSFLRLPSKNPADAPTATHQHTVLIIGNFTSITREHYRLGVPHPGTWQETIRTDDTRYGGQSRRPRQEIVTQPIPWDGHPQAIDIALPGMSILFLQLKTEEEQRHSQ